VSKRKSSGARAPVAVVINKREWRQFVAACADALAAAAAARDLVVQLQALLTVKRRQSDAGRKAHASRQSGAAEADNGNATGGIAS
jgi:hypothetical protein